MAKLGARVRSALHTASRSYTVIIVVALLVGAFAAPTAYGAAKEYGETTDKVAVIEIGATIAPMTAEPVEEQLQEARRNESIEAVVLKVNTPGGGLSATESLALEVERTAEQMPVVVSVPQIAASGGYYERAGRRDRRQPERDGRQRRHQLRVHRRGGATGTAIQSGPDKSGGYTEAEAIEMADVMVEGFYGTVLEHRGDTLELTEEELAYAKVYPSQKAIHNGMIDEVGTTDTAIQRAAERAELDRYEVVELDTTPDVGGVPILAETSANATSSERVEAMLDPAPGVRTPVPLALYGTLPEQETIVTTEGEGTTVADDDRRSEEVRDDA